MSIKPIAQTRSFRFTSRLRDERPNSPLAVNGATSPTAPKAASENTTTTSADPWSTLKTVQPSSNAPSVFTRLHQRTAQPAPAATQAGDSASDLQNKFTAQLNGDTRRKVPTDQMQVPRSSNPLGQFGNMVTPSNPPFRASPGTTTTTSNAISNVIPAVPQLPPFPGSGKEVIERPMRLKPSLGRTVDIKPEKGIDLARGIAFLGMKLKENDVRGEHIRQRFHERPGLKRKRLKSVRWRKRFMKGFKSMVGLVRHMRAQGW